ncbi:hypothetical protein CDD82_283 [Ophiocordyceps australis]|uniref:RRM domain-containing protein n=1 Tax=Ophiocordyceps australis TaxID=1399860 RepID=A0A2C5ZKR6_9HYPO|nr:hypothetical protein CDD82_283 [Ophiocordyceps australis]
MATPKSHGKRQRSQVEDDAATTEAKEQSAKRPRVDESRSIFVRSLPPTATDESLADFFSQHFAVKHATVVLDQTTKQSRGYGFVTFADAQDAADAQKALDKVIWDGRCLRLDLAERRHRKATDGTGPPLPLVSRKPQFEKPPKLIIRNLPWSIKTSEQLAHLFQSFGKVKFADLPQNKGQLKGFGFVTLRGKANAEKALQCINGKQLHGRTLAVDWAVDKETWDKQNATQSGNEPDEQGPDDSGPSDASSPVAHSESSDPDAERAPSPASHKKQDSDLDADVANFMNNHMQNLEDESDGNDQNNSDSDDQDDDAFQRRNRGQNKPPHHQSTDNSSTIFVRNLPFTTTDEQLKALFGSFGQVRYARVVMDKVTDRPAGTGFVCFINEADAKKCIKGAPRPNLQASRGKHSLLLNEASDPSGMYTLDGRLLQVAQAVAKDEATNLAETALSKRREKDNRRLFLLSEGSIGRASPLFNLLTLAEIQMRQTSAAQRKKMVKKNPSLHLSLTRLAVRNIPRNIGAKELKELARKAIVGFAQDVKDGRRQPLSREEKARDGKDAKERERQRKLKGKGIVRQAKIVFESEQGSKVAEKTGAGKSRGYGFIEYSSHHWALMGLRYLNGYQMQGDNGRKQRLFVEFAIENAQVVQRRRAAEEKSAQAVKNKNKVAAAAATKAEDSNGVGDAQGEDADAFKTKKKKKDKGNDKGKGGKGGKGEGKDKNQAKHNNSADVVVNKPRKQTTKAQDQDKGDQTDSKAKSSDVKQTLIARKRLMRKKKAKARG